MRNTTDNDALSSDVWARYWRTGILHSCCNAYEGNYDGRVREFWAEVLQVLDEGAVVVDIGTGNGALALLAADIARESGRTWEIHGVDAAHIDPAASVPGDAHRFEGIRFHSDTPASRLPFPDSGVQAIVGQYALEYMPRQPVLAELARACAPGAVIGFVMHGTESLVCRTSAEELTNTRLIFEGTRFFQRAAEMIDIFVRAASPEQRQRMSLDSQVQSRRRAFNRAAEQISARIAATAEPTLLQLALGHARRAFDAAQAGRRDQAMQFLEFGRKDLWDSHCRLRDLVACALDIPGIERLESDLRSVGFVDFQAHRIEHSPGRDLGWAVRAVRR